MRGLAHFAGLSVVLALFSGCGSMPLGGGSNASAPETGIGQQAGSLIGGEIGGRYNPLGSTIGGQVGSQTERAVVQSAAAKPTR